jgi:predicted small lipoprotein YifL
MKRVFGVMVVLLLAVSFLAACGPGTPAEFTLSGVTVSPSAPVVNDTVTIAATVTNDGEQAGGCDVSLTIGDYTDSKSVSSLAGGASGSVSFSYDATTVGSYTVTLSTPDDSATKSLTVKEEGVDGNGNGNGDGVGAVPTWSVDDTWAYACSYANPDGRTKQDSGELVVTMIGEETVGGEACYKQAGEFIPPATRDAADMPLTLHVGTADIWTSKAHLVYVVMSSAIAELPGLPSTVTWTLTGDYGWPLEVGKTWSSSVRVVAGPLDIITELENKVLGMETITVPAGTFECYHIVAYEPTSPNTYTNEFWFNADDVKSNVKEIDRALWAGEETRELISYSVS